MPTQEIEELKEQLVNQLLPKRIYLFGSFAENKQTEESDLDIYIIAHEGVSDLVEETVKAYKAIRDVKKRPVDIVVGTQTGFDTRKDMMTVENEVYRKGVLLYDAEL